MKLGELRRIITEISAENDDIEVVVADQDGIGYEVEMADIEEDGGDDWVKAGHDENGEPVWEKRPPQGEFIILMSGLEYVAGRYAVGAPDEE